MAKYYSKISLKRMAELSGLSLLVSMFIYKPFNFLYIYLGNRGSIKFACCFKNYLG